MNVDERFEEFERRLAAIEKAERSFQTNWMIQIESGLAMVVWQRFLETNNQ